MKAPKLWIALAAGLGMCGVGGAAPEGPPAAVPLTFEMMATSVYHEGQPTEFPEVLKRLDGKRVRVSGFAMPFEDPENLAKFLMVKTVSGCFYCNPPGEDEVLLIRMGNPKAAPEIDGEKKVVEGVLHLQDLNSKDEEANQFLFTIDDAKLVPNRP